MKKLYNLNQPGSALRMVFNAMRNNARVIVLVLMTLVTVTGWGQTVGDYQTRRDGNWSRTDMWQRYNGSTWVNVTTYPGQSSGDGTVTILNTHDVVLDITPANSIAALVLQTGNRSSSITFGSSHLLTVSGNTTIEIPLDTDPARYKFIRVLAGEFSTANLIVNASTNDGRDSYVEISTGTVNVSGNITLNGNNSRNYILFTGDGVLNVGGTITGGGITRTLGGGATAPTSGTVNYNKATAQTVGQYTYNNLTLSGGGLKTTIGVTVNGILSMEGTATASAVPTYGANATIQYKGSSIQTTGVEFPATFNGTGGVIIDNANGVNMTGSHTIGGPLTLTNGAFSIGANTLTLNGTIPVCGSLTGGASSNLTIGGTATTANIPSVTLNNLTINRANGAQLCSGNVTVNGTLTLTNGKLTINDYDLVLGSSASISVVSPSGTKMIETNGSGRLVKQSATAAGLGILYPVGTGGNYTPVQMSSTTGSVAGTATLAVRAVAGRADNTNTTDLGKHWVLATTNLSGVFTNASFTYVASEVNGNESDYSLRYSTNPVGTWSAPANPALASRVLSTTGSNVIDGVWTAKEVNITWYTLRSGNWNDPTIWTLDPAGSLVNNPSDSYPRMADENVVVKNGRTVTMNISNVVCKNLTVEGTLDLASTSGHSFTTINGNGRIRMSANNSWPAGNATHFITPGQGQGTVEYYGNSFSLSTARTFYNMEVMMTAGQALTLTSNFTLNGNLEVKTGTFRINDASTTIRNIEVLGNVEVHNGASITTGNGNTIGSNSIGGTMPSSGNYHNIFHQFTVWGNFTNNGSVRFTNLTAPDYSQFANNGAVTVRFKGATNNTVVCNGVTDFYNLVVDKGTDQTYELEINSSAIGNFALYGPNNVGRNENAPFSASNPEVRKALWIYNGTLKLTGDIAIPTLSEGDASGGNGDYAIGSNACLWIASANASVYSTASVDGQLPADAVGLNTGSGNQGMSVYGKFRISAGTFGARNSAGLIFWSAANAVVVIEGGTCDVAQFRSASSGSGQASYIQSGGVVKVRGNVTEAGEVTNAYPIFGFETVDGTFSMSGGEILINAESGNANDIYIPVSAGNYNVTGGKLIINVNGSTVVDYNSTVPFYNIEIGRLNASNTASLSLRNALVALNDLSIGNNSSLVTNNNNVTIGGNFSLGATSSTFTAGTNTTTFNGAQNSTITNGSALTFNRVDISKSAHATPGQFYSVSLDGASTVAISNNLTITQGQLATKAVSPTVAGNIEIVKGAITNTSGTTVLNGGVLQTMRGDGQDFGSITLSNGSFGLQLLSDAIVNNFAFNTVGTAKVNLDVYNLTVKGAITNSVATRYIYGAGNASDGGLSMYINANGSKTYPVGIAAEYTPAVMTVAGYSDDGYVTIVPVNSALQTTNQAGGAVMPYYWKVKHDGFTALPSVTYVFTYAKADNTTYVPGKVLDVSPYTRTSYNDVSKVVETPTKTILFDTPVTLEKANYTTGENNRFTGSVRVFYSRDVDQQANWRATGAWTRNDLLNGAYAPHDSRQPSAGADYPQAGDVAVIGWIPWTDAGRTPTQLGQPHGIWADNRTETCAEVVFTPMTDASGNPVARNYRSNFQFRPCLCINEASGNLVAGMVRGEGMFWNRYSDPNLNNMDIGEFAAQDSSYVVYENTSGTIANTATVMPNLLIASSDWGNTDQNITLTKNINTTGNFEVLGDANIILPTGGTGDLTIGRDLVFFERGTSGGGAQLLFGITGTARTVSVGRDLILNNNGARISLSGWSTADPDLNHNLLVGRNIYQKTTSDGLDFWNATDQDFISLTLFGSESMTYTYVSGAVPDLYRLIVDKGASVSTTATFSTNFTLKGSTSGAGISKALELRNGLFVINNGSVNLNLTTGNDYFSIPSTAGLELRAGTANATGTSGIQLDGLLKISGGTLNMAGGDNPIVYGAGSASTIDVSAGTLTVGGQIRRGANSEVGYLKYIQSGGNVYVGRTTTSVATRGTLEVLGAGSEFNVTGGNLYIERASSATVPGLYLMPGSYNLSTGNTINIGSASVAGQSVGVYSSVPLQNLQVLNGATARMLTVPLTLNGNLTINSGTFNANGLDLNVGGNFVNNATFTHGNNTVTFTGGAVQNISGSTSTEFYNLTKQGTSILNTLTAATVKNNLNISDGSLADNGNTLTVNGNVAVEGTHVFGSAGEGIRMTGSLMSQTLTGNGTIGMLTINNTKGVYVPIGNLLTISDKLRLNAGVFNIDKNLLSLGVNCIIDGNAPSALNMIQTNVSFTDNGVKKFFPAGASGNFVFPVGSNGKYTPVSFNVTGNGNATGSIRVKPAAEYHPSIQEDSEAPSTEIVDRDNVLQYYWTFISSGISGFNATASLKYDQGDVKVTNGNTEAQYLAARLLAGEAGEWNKYTSDEVDDLNNLILFSYTNAQDGDISGDYTAGIDNAIPAKVPQYVSVKDGDWTDVSVWDTYPVSGGFVPSTGPRGSIARVNHRVESAGNGIVSYQTIINGINGNLVTNATYGHRLGVVSGTGTLTCSVGDLPAADYSDFFLATGGTLEYNGASNIDILTDLPVINNLLLSGSGVRKFPNINVQLLGSLTINGPVVDNDTYDKTIGVKGNVTFNSGTFTAGNQPAAKLVMNGATLQTINGTSSFTTSTNDLYHFEINNSAGVKMERPVDVSGNLTLLNGVLTTTSANLLSLTSVSGTASAGSATAYVNGPMRKLMNSGATFAFPVGKANRFGAITVNAVGAGGYWQTEYFNNSPSLHSMPTSSMAGDVKFVSQSEFWNVLAPSATTASLTLRWDAASGVEPSEAGLRAVQWIPSAWNEVALGTKFGTAASGYSITSAALSFNANAGGNYITFGSISIPAYTWLGTTDRDWFNPGNWSNNAVPSSAADITINNVSNKPIVNPGAVAAANNVAMVAGSTLTLNPGARMTVNGNITNHGGDIVLVNTATQPASLLTYGTVSNAITTQWTYPTGKYIALGHSVDGNLYANYGGTTKVAISKLVNNGWASVTSDVGFNANPLMGYYVGFRTSQGTEATVQHTGTLRQGAYSYPMGITWEMIANPYASYIDIESADFNINGHYNSVYVANMGVGQVVFATYNKGVGVSANGGSRYIAPGQSFYIRSLDAAKPFLLGSTARTHGTGAALKSASTVDDDVLRVKLTNGTVEDENVLVFRSIGDESFSPYYDSEKRFTAGATEVSLYTKKDERSIIINALPEDLDDRMVPLYMNVGANAKGTLSLKAANLTSFRQDAEVYLLDKETGETMNLRENPVYSFTAEAGSGQQRFELQFKSVSSVQETVEESQKGESTYQIDNQISDCIISVFGVGSKAVVNIKDATFSGEVSIEVKDALGRLVVSQTSVTARTEVSLPVKTQFFVVTVLYKGKVKTFKIISSNGM
jgi:hypothetical protein